MKIRDEILLLISGLLVLAFTIGVFVKENNSEWRDYQVEFTQLVSEKLGPKIADSIEPGLHQVWNPQLNITDRCQTCHLGIGLPGLENEKQPFATHPNLSFYKQTHPFKDYGCTSCHDGQGHATKTKDAHGEVHHWMTPMYTNKLAEEYGFKDSRPMIEISCNQCHRRDRKTEGMEWINMAKKLLEEKKCSICHVIEGKGLTVGPELTYEGSKFPEGFIFDTVEGKKSVLNWHIKHFKDPQQVSKDSLMINFKLKDEEAEALSLLMMGWRKKTIPIEYIPSPYRSDSTKPLPPEPAVAFESLDGKTLYTKRLCHICHGEDGRSTTGAYPSLADQTYFYLINQMNDIKSGARKSGNAEIMKPHVLDVSDKEIEIISKYLTDLK